METMLQWKSSFIGWTDTQNDPVSTAEQNTADLYVYFVGYIHIVACYKGVIQDWQFIPCASCKVYRSVVTV